MISVIIPAKDAAMTIGDCLAALQYQDGFELGADYEVIVVDDGSSDNTADIAARLSARVICQVNRGPAAARNAGVKVASGTILAFTDADCVPSKDWLQNLTQPFTNPEIVGVKGAYLTRQVGLVARFVQLEYEYKDTRMRKLAGIDFIDTFSAAYRKDIFVANGGFDESFPSPAAAEDLELSFRLARKGYRMLFRPEATVYHIHDRNLMEYMHRKFRIGYWGAFMLHWTSEKMFTDSHTAPTQRIEILLLGLMFLSLPFIALWPAYASLVFLTLLAIFLIVTSPFQLFIAKKDRQVVWIASSLLLVRAGSLGVGLLKGFLLPPRIQAKGLPCQSITIRAIKRLLDVFVGLVGLILSAPLIACASLAIRLDSKGPAIFKQYRAGEFGKPFTIYKLRTMVDGAESMVADLAGLSQLKGPAFKIPNDPRVTRVGRYLRRWSLDELPQFWNIFRGDMSLVGPRPEVMLLVNQYSDDQRQRLIVKPGLTGPVQVSGRGELDFDQSFQIEMDYLKKYALLEDVKILLQTIPAILSGRGIT